MRRCAGARWRARAAMAPRASSRSPWSRNWCPSPASTAPPTRRCRPTCGPARRRCGWPTIVCRSSPSLPELHIHSKKDCRPMTKIVVVTSGKGGVGKTTTSASFAAGLALQGQKTAVIDFDVGLRNLDLIMGCERRVVYDLVNVINGEAKLNQALIKDRNCENLFILPASQTRDKDALTEEGVEQVLKELEHMGFDYVVCDSPAGIERGAVLALTFADEAIVTTNPEV